MANDDIPPRFMGYVASIVVVECCPVSSRLVPAKTTALHVSSL